MAVLRAAIQAIWSAPSYDPAFDGVLDATEAQLHLSLGDVYRLFRMVRESPQHVTGRFAFVSPQPFGAAMAMLYERRSHLERRVSVFSTREAAEAWLDLPPGT